MITIIEEEVVVEEEDVVETVEDIEIMLGTKIRTQKHLEKAWPKISSTNIQIIEVVVATVATEEAAMDVTTTIGVTIVIIITK